MLIETHRKRLSKQLTITNVQRSNNGLCTVNINTTRQICQIIKLKKKYAKYRMFVFRYSRIVCWIYVYVWMCNLRVNNRLISLKTSSVKVNQFAGKPNFRRASFPIDTHKRKTNRWWQKKIARVYTSVRCKSEPRTRANL